MVPCLQGLEDLETLEAWEAPMDLVAQCAGKLAIVWDLFRDLGRHGGVMSMEAWRPGDRGVAFMEACRHQGMAVTNTCMRLCPAALPLGMETWSA